MVSVVAAPSPVVTISGFRALAALAPASPPAVLQPLLPTLLAALVEMLPGAGEEAMHLVLELLRELVDAASRADLASGGFQLSESAALAVARPVLQVCTAGVLYNRTTVQQYNLMKRDRPDEPYRRLAQAQQILSKPHRLCHLRI